MTKESAEKTRPAEHSKDTLMLRQLRTSAARLLAPINRGLGTWSGLPQFTHAFQRLHEVRPRPRAHLFLGPRQRQVVHVYLALARMSGENVALGDHPPRGSPNAFLSPQSQAVETGMLTPTAAARADRKLRAKILHAQIVPYQKLTPTEKVLALAQVCLCRAAEVGPSFRPFRVSKT